MSHLQAVLASVLYHAPQYARVERIILEGMTQEEPILHSQQRLYGMASN